MNDYLYGDQRGGFIWLVWSGIDWRAYYGFAGMCVRDTPEGRGLTKTQAVRNLWRGLHK